MNMMQPQSAPGQSAAHDASKGPGQGYPQPPAAQPPQQWLLRGMGPGQGQGPGGGVGVGAGGVGPPPALSPALRPWQSTGDFMECRRGMVQRM
jgi:hypothetical protein